MPGIRTSVRPLLAGSCRSGQNASNDVRFLDTRQLLIDALILVGKLLMIYAKLVQQRGLQVADVHRACHHVVRELVGFAVNDAALHATAGHPEAEAARMVVAAVVGRGKLAL